MTENNPLKIASSTPWYSAGLRFKCTECGQCCTGAPGYVWVTKEEIQTIADYLNLPLKDFQKKFLRMAKGRYALIEKQNYDCVFLKDKKCTIYPARPFQCRTFPWWTQNLTTPEAWKEAASYCEGISQQAPVVPFETIQSHLVGEPRPSFSFGTGGMRGLMGDGPNQINLPIVRTITQGLANYLHRQPAQAKDHSVLIGFDSRHNSPQFAQEAAKVLAANGIQVFLFKDLKPTPLISYGCRLRQCSAAIMVTASHNPREYNGLKIYWSDGGQVLPPHDTGIVEEVKKIASPVMIKSVPALDHPLITLLEEEIDAAYVEETSHLPCCPQENRSRGKELKILYTSLHGTGIRLVPKILSVWGFSSLSFIEKQIVPDGDFPTVKSPNPEDESALALGLEQLCAEQGDILLATDPDADRLGVAVLHQGQAIVLTGNQVACLCLDHICSVLSAQSRMKEKAACIQSIATTELFQTICSAYQIPCSHLLPGFKYIGEKISAWEKDPDGPRFLFAGEDSCGYLLETLTRDKDGLVAAALVAEAALQAKLQGKTLIDLLHALYRKHGAFAESSASVSFEESDNGKTGIKQTMDHFRKHLPLQIEGIDVVTVEDYLSSTRTFIKTGKSESLALPVSDILLLRLQDNSKLIVRPSGTEPKLKLYCGVVTAPSGSVEDDIKRSNEKANQLLTALIDTLPL